MLINRHASSKDKKSWMLSYVYALIKYFFTDKYKLTFRATGCKNKDPPTTQLDYWKSQPDGTVFSDMMSYCTQTFAGSASSEQKEKCCGTSFPNCVPNFCVLQTQFTEGILIKRFIIHFQ